MKTPTFRPLLPLIVAALALLAGKWALAAHLSLFGDEAFYWWESRHLAWAYSDLPGLTQWMIALSEALFGGSYAGVRALGALAGMLIPLLMWAIARALDAPRGVAILAPIGFFLLPLGNGLGLLALPDTWLNLWALACAWLALRALSSNKWTDFGALGLALAAGLATHPRFVVWIAAMLPFLLLSPLGRAWWGNPRFWFAALLGLLGLWPTLWFNFAHAYENLQFQLLDRHPWRFALDGLKFYPEQLFFTFPSTVALLLGIVYTARKQKDPRWQLLLSLALSHWLFYALLAPFADRERLTVHWTLPSYLLLLCLLPCAYMQWQRRTPALIACWASLVASFALLAVLGMGALGRDQANAFNSKWLPENFIGWREAAALQRMVEPNLAPGTTIVADNFMLAAQLAFELKRPHDIYVLDHDLNAKHGRALQLRIWNRDGRAAAARARRGTVVLIAELSASKRDALPAWISRFCPALGPLDLVVDFSLVAERKRLAILRSGNHGCELPAIGYVGFSANGLKGWHWRNGAHVTGFELRGRNAEEQEVLLQRLPPAQTSDAFVPAPFSIPLPADIREVELSARYAQGGVVVIAADRR